jgi:hypothetical protein
MNGSQRKHIVNMHCSQILAIDEHLNVRRIQGRHLDDLATCLSWTDAFVGPIAQYRISMEARPGRDILVQYVPRSF